MAVHFDREQPDEQEIDRLVTIFFEPEYDALTENVNQSWALGYNENLDLVFRNKYSEVNLRTGEVYCEGDIAYYTTETAKRLVSRTIERILSHDDIEP